MPQPTSPDKPALTVAEPDNLPRLRVIEADAGKYIGMSRPWLKLQRKKKTGPAFIRVGRSIRYDLRDLDQWLESHKVKGN